MADSGFGGGRGATPNYLTIFSPKIHENEDSLVRGESLASPRAVNKEFQNSLFAKDVVNIAVLKFAPTARERYD